MRPRHTPHTMSVYPISRPHEQHGPASTRGDPDDGDEPPVRQADVGVPTELPVRPEAVGVHGLEEKKECTELWLYVLRGVRAASSLLPFADLLLVDLPGVLTASLKRVDAGAMLLSAASSDGIPGPARWPLELCALFTLLAGLGQCLGLTAPICGKLRWRGPERALEHLA